MGFRLQKNSKAGRKSDHRNTTIGAVPVRSESFGEVFQNSLQDEDGGRITRYPQAGKFNPVTGTYMTRTSEPKSNRRLWPWILLAFAAVALISTALNNADPTNIAPSASPDAAAAMVATVGQAADPGQQNSPTDDPAKQVILTSAPVITSIPSPVQPVTPTPAPAATPDPNSSVLKYGSKGDAVKTLQGQLIDLGYLPLNADDGQFGDGTLAAVKSFQKINKLTADGIAGEKTLALLGGGQAKEDPDIFVWVVSKGTEYHTDPTCSDMKEPKQIKKSEAEKRKLKPCEKCN